MLISTAEVAQRLGIHHFSVCRIIRRGRLPAQLIGKSWVVREEDVEELLKTYEARRGRPRMHQVKGDR
ncbi:MAG: helix-turn-helix domain-containing protein [Nitrosopumilus sp.]